MVDIAAIGGAIGSIRAAGDIANAMLKLHDAKALQDKTIELNRIILSAQHDAIAANAAQLELVARINQLEKEISDLKSWEADKVPLSAYRHRWWRRSACDSRKFAQWRSLPSDMC